MSNAARVALIAFAALLFLAAVLLARPVATPGPAARDLEAYWSAGAAFNAGADPYDREIWKYERAVPGVDASRDEVLPFVGPPHALLLWSVFARVPYDRAAIAWSVLLALCIPAIALLLMRRIGIPGAIGFFAIVLVALSFGPVTSDLALGQVALVALVGAIAACHPERSGPRPRSRRTSDPIIPAIGTLIASLQPNIALPLVSQIGRNRATIGLIAGGVAAYLLGAIVAGWAWPVRYLQLLAAHANAERFSQIQITPAAIAYGFGASPALATTVAILAALTALAAAVFLWRSIADRFARFAAFAALAPFVATFFHEHDLIVALPAAVLCAAQARGSARTIALCGTLLVAIDWLGLAQRPTGIGQSALIALAAILAFTALGTHADLRGATFVTIAIGIAFAGASWLALQHPSPVWPDALGAYHAPAGADAATIWAQEQERTGLLTGAPVAAMLRSLSLLGCALLAAAVLRLQPPMGASAQDDVG